MGLGIPSAARGGKWGPLSFERWGRWGEARGAGVLILNMQSWSTKNLRLELSFQVSELNVLGVWKTLNSSEKPTLDCSCQVLRNLTTGMGVSPVAPSENRRGTVALKSVSKLHEQCHLDSGNFLAVLGCVCWEWRHHKQKMERGGLITEMPAAKHVGAQLVFLKGVSHVHLFQYLDWETTLWGFCFLLC